MARMETVKCTKVRHGNGFLWTMKRAGSHYMTEVGHRPKYPEAGFSAVELGTVPGEAITQ